MRTSPIALAGVVLLMGCATPSAPAPRSSAVADANRPAQAGTPRADRSAYPPDVRAFLEDRALCDHFRGEPWPESDSDADRERRLQIVDGVRTACAGTDRRLTELLDRYRSDIAVMERLSEFERDIENRTP